MAAEIFDQRPCDVRGGAITFHAKVSTAKAFWDVRGIRNGHQWM
jgi:hypothetical protein